MKLKSSLLLMGALTTLSWSCTNASNEFRIEKFYPVGPGCDGAIFKTDSLIGNGYLDVAAGNPTVVVGVQLSGAQNVKQTGVTVGQRVLETENRNRPLVTSMVVNYRLSKRVGPTPKPYIQYVTLPFTEAGEIFGPFQILSPELGQALFDGLTPSSGVAPSNTVEDFVDIQMDVEFKGEWSATKNNFTTGVLTYPVRAYRSNPTSCGTTGYVRFTELTAAVNPMDGGVVTPAVYDPCSYVGFQFHQLSVPPAPSVCCANAGC